MRGALTTSSDQQLGCSSYCLPVGGGRRVNAAFISRSVRLVCEPSHTRITRRSSTSSNDKICEQQDISLGATNTNI
jgi:hypothetical protein